MTVRTLGQTDLRITPIGIGAWAIGGGQWEFAWGHQDDEQIQHRPVRVAIGRVPTIQRKSGGIHARARQGA